MVSRGRFSVRTWETIYSAVSNVDMVVEAMHRTYGRSSGSEEDQGAEVSSALVGESAGSVDESTNTVRLDGRADDGATPRGGGGGSLLGVEVLLLGVGLLCAAVGVTENGAEDGE